MRREYQCPTYIVKVFSIFVRRGRSFTFFGETHDEGTHTPLERVFRDDRKVIPKEPVCTMYGKGFP